MKIGQKLKHSYSNVSNFFSKIIMKMDEKVKPNVGYQSWKWSRITNLVLLLFFLPILSLVLGMNILAYHNGLGIDYVIKDEAQLAVIITFWLLYALSLFSWIYFSKWSDEKDDLKEQIRLEKKEVKINKLQIKKEEAGEGKSSKKEKKVKNNDFGKVDDERSA